MIKDLISELAYDKISLSQALTRSKLVAYKIHNDEFKGWLRRELEGYYDDSQKLLPEYRRLGCQLYITYSLPNGQQHSKPVMIIGEAGQDFYETINYYPILEPAAVIEQQIAGLKEIAYIHLSAEEAYNLCKGDRNQQWIIGGYRKIGKGQLQNIIELTKQKLLDTLLELDNQFPELTNEFENTSANMEKVKNIITNNIYGNNNPLNIAAGYNADQKGIQNTFHESDSSELEKLGVTSQEVAEFKQILLTHGKDKPSLKQKALKWLATVSTSVVTKGLSENLPALIEFVHKFI